MTGYRFRLDTVSRVRALQEEQARARLAAARRADETARADTGRRRGVLARAGHGGATESSTTTWHATRDRQDRLAAALRAAQAAESHAADLVLERSGEWEAAAVALRSLETLDERHRQTWRDERRRAEQAELDELSAARFGRGPSSDDQEGS